MMCSIRGLMRVVYRNLLEIRSTERSAPQVSADLHAMVVEWAASSAAKYTKDSQIPVKEGTYELGCGATVRIDISRSRDGQAEVFSLKYTHADQQYVEPRRIGMVWSTECRVSRVGTDVEFDVAISCGYADYRIAPLDASLGTPRILKRVMEKFDCYRSGIPIYGSFKAVDAAGVPNLVSNLAMPNRILPYVIVSPNHNGKYALEPEELAQELSGLGVVYALANDAAADALMDAIGRQHGVYGGAVRINYPGFTAKGNPYRNPLLTKNYLESVPPNARKSIILRRLAFAASSLNWKGRFEEARKKILVDDRARLIAQVKGVNDTANLTELLNKQIERNRQLEDERDRAIENLQSVHAMYQEQEDLPPPPFSGETVLDAVEYSQKFHRNLWIWPDALKTAGKDTSKRGEEVYQCLARLNELVDDRQKSVEVGPLGDYFKSKNLPYKYTDHEKDETVKKHKSHYTFNYQGRELEARRHFRIGKGSVDNCVQVFWEFDDQVPRIIVFHAGRHLPTDSWVS